jgi:hypothetical protein
MLLLADVLAHLDTACDCTGMPLKQVTWPACEVSWHCSVVTSSTQLSFCCLLQALGVPVSSAQRILAKSKGKGPTFIAQGPVKQLVSEQPSLPVQWPKMIHRFPLLDNTYAVSGWLLHSWNDVQHVWL